MKLLAFLLPLLLTGCVFARSTHAVTSDSAPSVARVLVQGYGLFDGAGKGTPEEVLAALKAAQSTAQGAEKLDVDGLIPLVQKLAAGVQTLTPDDYRAVAKLMERTMATHPDDFDLQLSLASGIDTLDAVARGSGDPGEGGEALTRARALAARFPGQARAHAHLGQVIAATGGDEVQALRCFARCLSLDPGNLSCRGSFRTLADEYERPRCSKFKTDAFGLHPAYERGQGPRGSGREEVRVGGQTLGMEKAAALDGADVEDIDIGGRPAGGAGSGAQAVGRGEDGTAFRPVDGPEVGMLTIYLTPAAAARFSDLTARLARERGYLAIVANGTVVSAAKVMSQMDGGSLQIDGTGIDLKTLCATFETTGLPDDLQGIRRD
jgi:hypothetical protein